MKKIVSIALALVLVTGILWTGAYGADGALYSNGTVYYDSLGFENSEAGSAVTGFTAPQNSATSFSVKQEEDGNKYADFYEHLTPGTTDSNGRSVRLLFDSERTSVFTAEFDYKRFTDDVLGIQLRFNGTETGPCVNMQRGSIRVDQEYFYGQKLAADRNPMVVANMSADRWYRIKLVIDPAKQYIDLYIDGDLTAKKLYFRKQNSKAIRNMELCVLGSNDANIMHIGIDNLKISEGGAMDYYVYSEFSAAELGTTPAQFSKQAFAEKDYLNVSYDKEYGRYLDYYAEKNGTKWMYNVKPYINEQTVTLDFDMIVHEDSQGAFQINMLGEGTVGSGAFVNGLCLNFGPDQTIKATIKTSSGSSSALLGSYKKGIPFKMTVIVDFSQASETQAAVFDFYIDGVLLKQNVAYRDLAKNVIQVSLISSTPSTIHHIGLDNLTISGGRKVPEVAKRQYSCIYDFDNDTAGEIPQGFKTEGYDGDSAVVTESKSLKITAASGSFQVSAAFDHTMTGTCYTFFDIKPYSDSQDDVELTLASKGGQQLVVFTVQSDGTLLAGAVKAGKLNLDRWNRVTLIQDMDARKYSVCIGSERVLTGQTFVSQAINYNRLEIVAAYGAAVLELDNIKILHEPPAGTALYDFDFEKAQPGTVPAYFKNGGSYGSTDKLQAVADDEFSQYLDFYSKTTNTSWMFETDSPVTAEVITVSADVYIPDDNEGTIQFNIQGESELGKGDTTNGVCISFKPDQTMSAVSMQNASGATANTQLGSYRKGRWQNIALVMRFSEASNTQAAVFDYYLNGELVKTDVPMRGLTKNVHFIKTVAAAAGVVNHIAVDNLRVIMGSDMGYAYPYASGRQGYDFDSGIPELVSYETASGSVTAADKYLDVSAYDESFTLTITQEHTAYDSFDVQFDLRPSANSDQDAVIDFMARNGVDAAVSLTLEAAGGLYLGSEKLCELRRGEWNTLRASFRLAEQQYDLYVNDSPVVSGQHIASNVSNIRKLMFTAYGELSFAVDNYWVDYGYPKKSVGPIRIMNQMGMKTESLESSQPYTACLEIVNPETDAITGALIYAVYDSGRLVKTVVGSQFSVGQGKETVTLEIEAMPEVRNKTVKVFAMKGLESLEPLTGAAKLGTV